MKASLSDANADDEEAEENASDEPIVFDYSEFFSVLMYYYGMSKDEILSHSRGFLHGLYRMYYKRACENLGVSSAKSDKDEEDDDSTEDENGYPKQFVKLPSKGANIPQSSPEATHDYMAAFGGDAMLFKNARIVGD